MAFHWNCGPDDFKSMGNTYRVGIGLDKPEILPGERELDAWARSGMDGITRTNKGPLLARFLYHHADELPAGPILDFGCGAGAVQVRALYTLGFDVDGYEWPPNYADTTGKGISRARDYDQSVDDGYIDPFALERTEHYDIVMASNVLNVQPTWGCFWTTINLIRELMAPGGVFICNMAGSPREVISKGRRGDGQTEALLEMSFQSVTRYEKSILTATKKPTDKWIWVCADPVFNSDAMQRDITLAMLGDGRLAIAGGL